MYQQMTAAGFVPGENLFEFQPVFSNKSSSDSLIFFEGQCDYYVSSWEDFRHLSIRMGIESPEEIFGYKDAPKEVFGEALTLYLAASKDFDPAMLKVLQDSVKFLTESGQMHKTCGEFELLERVDCRVLMPKTH